MIHEGCVEVDLCRYVYVYVYVFLHVCVYIYSVCIYIYIYRVCVCFIIFKNERAYVIDLGRLVRDLCGDVRVCLCVLYQLSCMSPVVEKRVNMNGSIW
jgi:hypothetical protein